MNTRVQGRFGVTSKVSEEADEFFSEYDALTSNVERSRHQFFQTNLERWFSVLDSSFPFSKFTLQLETGVDFEPWYQACLQTMGGMVGSATLSWPPDPKKRLGLQLLLFRKFANGTVHPEDFAIHFLYRSNHFDDMVSDIVGQIFTPLAGELRRYFLRQIREHESEQHIPASDRTVRLDHNSPDYHQAIDALEATQRAVEAINDYDDAEDKAQRIAEISAGRRLLSVIKVRTAAVITVLGGVLFYLLKKFADNAVGQLAGTALSVLGKLFHIDFTL